MGRKRATPFDPKTFMTKVDSGKKILRCRKKQILFSQGDASDAVFYVLGGNVKLTGLSHKGKEAVIAILGKGEFFEKPASPGNWRAPLPLLPCRNPRSCASTRLP
jgi:CRP/FNR family transcriptional regulator, cyclic AMP receptor protein